MKKVQGRARIWFQLQQISIAFLFLIGVIAFFSVGVKAQADLEEPQTSSQDFAPVGIIHVVTSAVQTDSASVDDVLIPAVEAALEAGVPPGNVVSLTRFAMKMGLTVEELADAVDRLNELIAAGMPPGQALNQVKSEIETSAESEEDTEAVAASPSNSQGNSGNNGDNNGNSGNSGNQGQGNGPPEGKGPKDKDKKK